MPTLTVHNVDPETEKRLRERAARNGRSIEAELRRSARLDFTRGVKIVPAQLGDDAGVLGAARLAFASLSDA